MAKSMGQLEALVIRNFKRLRLARHWTQDRLALEVQKATGRRWTRSGVAAIERGERVLTFAELVVLLLVFDTTVGEFLDGPEPVEVGEAGGLLLPEDRAAIASGKTLAWSKRLTGKHNQAKAPAAPSKEELDVLWKRYLRTGNSDKLNALLPPQFVFASTHDAEQKISAKLGVDARWLTLLAHRLWGHGLTAERERRLSDFSEEGESARTTQARRGHISRELTDELKQLLRKHVR